MWESQASLLPLLDEELITEMYKFNQYLDTFLAHRQKMYDVFEKEENKKLWNDYLDWIKAYDHDDSNKRDEAQNGEEGRAMDKKVTEFSTSLIPQWNEINNLYKHVHDLGNPILTKKKRKG